MKLADYLKWTRKLTKKLEHDLFVDTVFPQT